uniref:FXYD domain-containing ion transport regulator n=1 Tax=Hucho hucho TaxID=62062 RepID=A0A4W5M6E9_9TELE
MACELYHVTATNGHDYRFFFVVSDYETLRTTGVIIGVILFVSGILIALSKKLTCSKSSSNSNTAGTQIPKTEVPPQTV